MTKEPAAQPSRMRRKLKLAAAVAAAVTVAVTASGCTAGQSASAAGTDTGKPPKAPTAEGFAPYVDTSLQPSFDLLANSGKTGVKEFNLAFVVAGGGCTPKWGGKEELSDNAVAKQIKDFRAKGGDVRVSFGGAAGQELGLACGSANELAAAYGKVIDELALKKVDFDIEGAKTVPDTKANTKRAQAIAQLQQKHKDLDVSFTLPVLPNGMKADAVALLEDAKKNNVRISAVNIMAMDYGPSFDGDMGKYAIAAAKASQKQVKSALGIQDEAQAWKTLAVTPMIGVNDVKGEVFKKNDAVELRKFAKKNKLGWLSMWSSTRDKACTDGPKETADPACSSIVQRPDAFAKAFIG